MIAYDPTFLLQIFSSHGHIFPGTQGLLPESLGKNGWKVVSSKFLGTPRIFSLITFFDSTVHSRTKFKANFRKKAFFQLKKNIGGGGHE